MGIKYCWSYQCNQRKHYHRKCINETVDYEWCEVLVLADLAWCCYDQPGSWAVGVNHSCIHPEQKSVFTLWCLEKNKVIKYLHQSQIQTRVRLLCTPTPMWNIPNKQCSIEISFETSKTEQFFVLDSHFYYLFQCQFCLTDFHTNQSQGLLSVIVPTDWPLFRTLKRWLKSWFCPKRIPISHQTEPTMHVLSCLRSYVNLVIDVIIFRKCRPKEKSCWPWICTA